MLHSLGEPLDICANQLKLSVYSLSVSKTLESPSVERPLSQIVERILSSNVFQSCLMYSEWDWESVSFPVPRDKLLCWCPRCVLCLWIHRGLQSAPYPRLTSLSSWWFSCLGLIQCYISFVLRIKVPCAPPVKNQFSSFTLQPKAKNLSECLMLKLIEVSYCYLCVVIKVSQGICVESTCCLVLFKHYCLYCHKD